MQTAYFEAVVNRPHRVLGRKLHAFCLYDALFLEIAQNPLWLGGRAPELADLQAAALICSLPPERFLRAELAPRSVRERLARAAWQIGILGRLRARAGYLSAELENWQAYVADHHSLPSLWDAAGKSRRLRAPWILSLATLIEMHSNMTEREIMTASIGLMQWKAQTIAERLGISAAEMMTEDEIAIAEEQRLAMAAAGETFPEDEEDVNDG